MTDPTREQMLERIAELERMQRCVQLLGYGYLLNHGGKQIALDPKDVTVVLPSTRHLDDFDLHNALHLTEQKLAAARRRVDELEGIIEASVLVDVFAERDEARQQVQVLQDRIAKVREFAEDMKTWCSPFGISLRYANRLLAVLDEVPDTPELADLAVGDCPEDSVYDNKEIGS